MGREEKIITEDNINEWLSSLGYLFPRNKIELARFEKLFSDYEYELNENCVDPYSIVNGNFKPREIKFNDSENNDTDFRMAARNLEGLPQHIIDKVKKNQNGLDSKKERSEEGED
jgi:hypothetical protein